MDDNEKLAKMILYGLESDIDAETFAYAVREVLRRNPRMRYLRQVVSWAKQESRLNGGSPRPIE